MPDLHAASADSVGCRAGRPVDVRHLAATALERLDAWPTTTACSRRAGAPARRAARSSVRRRPLRCPTVKRCTPSCRPSTLAVGIGDHARPVAARASAARRTARSRRRARSRSPGCPACRRPAGLARARMRAPRTCQPADRERRARCSCCLRQRKQEVRLVLARVAAAEQAAPAGPRIVRRAARSARWRRSSHQSRPRDRPASRTSGRCCSGCRESACGPAAYSPTKFATTVSWNCRSRFRT